MRRRRRRRPTGPSGGVPPWFPTRKLPLLLLLFFLQIPPGVQAITLQQCKIFLAASDTNRDDNLDRNTEFPRFATVMTHNTYTTFAAIPASFSAIYDKYAAATGGTLSVAGSRPGSNPTPTQTQTLDAMCNEWMGVLPTKAPVATAAPIPVPVPGPVTPAAPGAVNVPFTTCRVSMAVSDTNRDNQLSQQEYVTFLNRLTANRRGYTSFAGLPAGLQSTFSQLSGGAAQLAIPGASPASFVSATDAQKAVLEQICSATQAALNNDSSTGAPINTPIVPATPAAPATMPLPQCRVSLAIADINRDNQVTAQEYVSFINRLTRNQYAGTSFEGLPAPLQQNFNTLAAATPPPTTLDVTGAQPAQFTTATDAQKAFLERICVDTQKITVELAATAAPVGTIVPVGTPAPVGSLPPGITLIPFIQCRARMHAVDTNRDYLMNQAEYASFVDRLVPTARYPNFASLPAPIQTTYGQLATTNGQINIFGALPSQQTTPAQLAYLEKVCTDTQVAIGGQTTPPAPATLAPTTAIPVTLPPTTAFPLASLPPTYAAVDTINCGVHMNAADANKDGLMSQQEYTNFLWLLTNNERFGGFTYEILPQLLKNNFVTLSAGGAAIDVRGSATSAPGVVVTDEQLQIIAAVCAATIGAINQYILLTATPAPTAPQQVVTPLPTCKLWLNQYDADNNYQLTQIEYTNFVNQMATSQTGPGWTNAPAFALLPSNVQGIFSGFAQPAGGAYIPINGVNPAIPATAAEEQNLQNICTNVDTQIYQSMYVGTEAPVPVQTIPPTPRPTVDLQTCKVYIGQADSNFDNYLVTQEYTDFVNFMSTALQVQTAGVTYDVFHPVLKRNFEILASEDISTPNGRPHFVEGIDVFGARIQQQLQAAETQLQFVNRVCVDTAYAIQDALAPPSPAPTTGPTLSMAPTAVGSPTEAPTQFDGLVLIYNSFIVYNLQGIDATTLNLKNDQGDYLNKHRNLFGAVYKEFIQGLVRTHQFFPGATYAPIARGRFLRSQQRRFLIGVAPNSAIVREFEDMTCPLQLTARPGSQSAACQKVYADYTIDAVEPGTQVEARDYYQNLTQLHMIPPYDPNLQTENGRYSSQTPIVVWGATAEVEGWSPPPTQAPTYSNNDPFDFTTTEENRIIGVVMVGLLALIALGIYFAWNDKDKIKRKWRAFKARQRELEEEDDGEENSKDGDKKKKGDNEDDDYEDGDEYDDEYEDEYDVEDPKNGKKNKRAKKLLGTLGKNVGKIGKRVGLGENDDDEDLGFGFQDENLLDFEDYIFDTPAELLTEQNRGANKLGEETGGKDRSAREGVKRSGALSTSVASGGRPAAMTDSVASSTSSMQGDEMSEEDDFDDYEFEDEYDSEDSEEDQDEDSFGLSLSESGDGEDTISSKGDDLRDEDDKDDGSLSSSDEQGAEGAALVGDNVGGMLEAARNNGENGENGGEGNENNDDGSESGSSYYSESTSSSHKARMEEYRNEVKELVAKVIPEELDNLSTMMDQFEGREAELINTLQNMEERTSTQRARAAVHKTKVKVNPNQVGGYSIASEGSAVIAAASTLGPEPQRRQPRVQQYDDYDDYDDEYSDEYSDEYYDDEYDDEYYDDYGDEGSYYSDEEGSYYSEYDEEGTYYSDEEGTYYDDEGYDDEGSYYSGEEEGSYYSGEEEGSYYSQDEGEGSFVSGEGSYDDYGDEEGSYYSGEEQGSYYSQDEGEGSYVSGEGSYDDQYDDEEGSYYSGEEEGSYYSQDEEGSYVSGEEDDYYDDEYEDGSSFDDRGR